MVQSGQVAAMPAFSINHPQTYIDIKVGDQGPFRVIMELFPDVVPKTAENFRALCTGEHGENLQYQNKIFHRILPGFMM